ncbi:MAG TPA: VCBS repeat-containing protein, partial [Planctomycetota bacterium]|nr:VCBS repeat-containing protein [Planctomycetota bacterium]
MYDVATRRRGFVGIGSILVLLGAGRGAVGQNNVLWQFGNPSPDFLGAALAGVGDTNADGVADLLVAAPISARGGFQQAGWAALLSGASGAVLWSVSGTEVEEMLGETIGAVGDVDGDGSPDVAIGGSHAPGNLQNVGRIRVHSGASGALLQEWNGTGFGDSFGVSVAGIGDLDADGFDDIVVGTLGSYGPGPIGRVQIFSGSSGSVLLTVTGTLSWQGFGSAVAGVGDVSGDGVPDFVVGVPGASPGATPQAGEARVYSGSTGALLSTFAGSGPGDEFGGALASPGDLDADAVPDLLVGAREGGAWFPPYAQVGAGYVRALSLATGAVLYTATGTGTYGLFGSSLSAIGDLDADGASEFVAGAPEYLVFPACCGSTGPGYARVYSGATGTLLASIQGTAFGDRFGSGVAG